MLWTLFLLCRESEQDQESLWLTRRKELLRRNLHFSSVSSSGAGLSAPASAVGNFTRDAPEPAQKPGAFTLPIAPPCATGDRWTHVSRLCLNPQSSNIRNLTSSSSFQKDSQNLVGQIFPEVSPCWVTLDACTHAHTHYWLWTTHGKSGGTGNAHSVAGKANTTL